MKFSKCIVAAFLLLALSSMGPSANAQRQSSSVNLGQVNDILRRLTKSSARFRNSLNATAGQSHTNRHPESDINSLERHFENARNQLNDRFQRSREVAADVRNVLQKAAPLNDFMSRRRSDQQAENDWAAVRSDLQELGKAYSVNWEWNRQTIPPVSIAPSYRLSDKELDQLIQRIENEGDAFRSSLTDAFDQSRYDKTRSEGTMNDAVRAFKKATDQLRNRFDAGRSEAGDVEQLLGQATPLDQYMNSNRLTARAQKDWTTLRGDLEGLARAYNFTPNWGNRASTN